MNRGDGRGSFGGEIPLDGNSDADHPAVEDTASSDSDGRPQRRPMGIAPSPEFSIDQDANVMAFRHGTSLRLLQTDGKKTQSESLGSKSEVSAKFVKDALVVETKAESGGKRKETYTVLQDGKLRADFDFEGFGRMPAVKFKLIYDPVTSSQ